MLIYIIPCIILLVVALLLKKREQAAKDDNSEKKSKRVKEKSPKAKKESVKKVDSTDKTTVDHVPQVSKKQQEDHSKAFKDVQALIATQEFSLAEAKINQLLNQNPEQHQFYLLLAQVHRKQDDEIATKQLISHLKHLKLFDIIEEIEKELAAEQRKKEHAAQEQQAALAAAALAAQTTHSTTTKDQQTVVTDQTESPKSEPVEDISQDHQLNKTNTVTALHQPTDEETHDKHVEKSSSEQPEQVTANTQPSSQNTSKDSNVLDFYTADESHTAQQEKPEQVIAAPTNPQEEAPTHLELLDLETTQKPSNNITAKDDAPLNDFEFTPSDSQGVTYSPETTKEHSTSDLDFNFSDAEPSTDTAKDLHDAKHLDFVLEPEDQIVDKEKTAEKSVDLNQESNQSSDYSTQNTALANKHTLDFEPSISNPVSTAPETSPAPSVENTTVDQFDFTFEPEVVEPSTPLVQQDTASENIVPVTATDILLTQFDELKQLDEAELNLDLATEYVTIGEYERAKQLLSASELEFSAPQKVKVEQLLNKMAS